MKLLLPLISVLAISAAVSCAVPYQGENAAGDYPEADSLLVSIVFQALDGHGTKITGVTGSDESSIGRWAVFAFDPSGHFRWTSSPAGSPITLQLVAGNHYT